MASSFKLPLLLLVSSVLAHAALGEIICEDIPNDMCTFAIASSGRRCSLETYLSRHGAMEYQCKTSLVVVERMAGYIENEGCVHACGVDRRSVGISSDALLEPEFTAKLCTSACYDNCPNIVDLYFNLASGEGLDLADVCKGMAMMKLASSGAALGPVSPAVAAAPAAV